MIQIRPATDDDRPGIAAVHVASIRGLAQRHYTEEQIDAWCAGKEPSLYIVDDRQLFVAVDGDEVLGFSELRAPLSEVRRVYVSPKIARKGIGMQLLMAVEEAARDHGLTRLQLGASLNAVAFYEKHGYRETGRGAITWDTAVSAACVLMEKDL